MDNFQTTFEAFASFGSAPSKEMDNSHFSKMLKECKIIGKSFTSTDADLLFSKVKAKEARKISFTEFKEKAIPEIAAKMKKTPADIEAMIANAAPKSSGTKADTVRFHDDKSTYTGAAKQGGPTNVDRNAGSLAGVVDRRQETIDNRGTSAHKKIRISKRRVHIDRFTTQAFAACGEDGGASGSGADRVLCIAEVGDYRLRRGPQ